MDTSAGFNYAISNYVKSGFRVRWKDAQACQLERPKKINLLIAGFFGIIFPLFGAIVAAVSLDWGLAIIGFSSYMIYLAVLNYLSSRSESVFLMVDAQGNIESIIQK